MRGLAPVHGFGGQDHQLPDRCIRLLCIAPRPCLHRPGALSAEGMDGRSHSPEGSACAGRCGFCHQASDRTPDDRTSARRQGAVFLCRHRHRLWHGRHRDHASPGRKGYVLGVAANRAFNSWGKKQFVRGTAAKIAQSLPKSPGDACRRAKEAKDRVCTTGLISNWPISMPANTTAYSRENGRAVCWSAATSATAISLSSPHGVPRARP